MQYLLGLAQLGHDVYYVEDSDDYPSCYNPLTCCTDTDPAYGLTFAHDAFARIGFADRWAYHDSHTSTWLGPCADRILALCQEADLLLNIAALNPVRPWMLNIPARVLIDGEAVFTQIRHLENARDCHRAHLHTAFFTFAENFGKQNCTVPDDGLPWQATRQPIALDAWPVAPAQPHGQFTSILNWDSIPAKEYNGIKYGMKSAAFQSYFDLPEKTGPIFQLAIGSPTAPRELLSSKGWGVLDSSELTRITKSPWTYQRFIQDSKAEFCINRHGFVISWSGWFSERSAVYLASGKPVLSQETGFSDVLPTGAGLLPFSSTEEALAGVELIKANYGFHCSAAREVAEAYFDARKVLSRLVELAMAPGHSDASKNRLLQAR
jgi:hypothetical protein